MNRYSLKHICASRTDAQSLTATLMTSRKSCGLLFVIMTSVGILRKCLSIRMVSRIADTRHQSSQKSLKRTLSICNHNAATRTNQAVSRIKYRGIKWRHGCLGSVCCWVAVVMDKCKWNADDWKIVLWNANVGRDFLCYQNLSQLWLLTRNQLYRSKKLCLIWRMF